MCVCVYTYIYALLFACSSSTINSRQTARKKIGPVRRAEAHGQEGQEEEKEEEKNYSPYFSLRIKTNHSTTIFFSSSIPKNRSLSVC